MLAKYCPRCNKPFECQMANIAECQCAKVKVSTSLKKWLATHFDNCLCSNCLIQLAEIDRIAQIIPFPKENKDIVLKYHYYIGAGKYVFTELYHYQKNHCCGNKCRHCVYGTQPL